MVIGTKAPLDVPRPAVLQLAKPCMEGAKMYLMSAHGPLGARLVQDPTKGSTGAICVGAVDPDGEAATRGIIAGMVLRGVDGEDVAEVEFDEVMLLCKRAKKAGKQTEDETWQLNLTSHWDLEPEEAEYWKEVLRKMDLDFGEVPADAQMKRQLKVDTKKVEEIAPVTYEEPVRYQVLAKATVRDGPESSSTKVGEYPKGSVIEVAHEQSNASGLRVMFTITPPPGSSRGGFVKLESSKGKVLLEKLYAEPPQTPEKPYHGMNMAVAGLNLSEGLPPASSSTDVTETFLSVYTRYKVIARATIRSGSSGESTRVGEYRAGMQILAEEESLTPDGLLVVRSNTTASSTTTAAAVDIIKFNGGWVKVMSSKGKRLLEKVSAVRAQRVNIMALAPDLDDVVEVELLELSFEGSGSLGLKFRPNQIGEVELYKISDDSVAATMPEAERGMPLRSISGTPTASMPFQDVVKMVDEHWANRGRVTLAFGEAVKGTPRLALPSAQQAASPKANPNDHSAAREETAEARTQESDAASPPSESRGEEEQEKEEEEAESPRESDTTSDKAPALAEAVPPATAAVQRRCPPELVAFMTQHGCEDYAEMMWDLLGVTRVEDLLHMMPEDLDALEMKVIPRRRLERALESARASGDSLAAQPVSPRGKWTVYISPFIGHASDASTLKELEHIVACCAKKHVESVVVKAASTSYTGFCDVCHIHDEHDVTHP